MHSATTRRKLLFVCNNAIVLAGLMLGSSLLARASDADWRTYRLGFMQTVLELRLPFGRLDEISRPGWVTEHKAPRIEWILNGRGDQVQVFDGMFWIKGPFWIGNYGRIDLTGWVNRKPQGFTGDLLDINVLKKVIEHQVVVLGRSRDYRFDIKVINNTPWVHWWSHDSGLAESAPWVMRKDRFSRALTDDLFIDVAVDLASSSQSRATGWIADAEQLRQDIWNSLVINYPDSR